MRFEVYLSVFSQLGTFLRPVIPAITTTLIAESTTTQQATLTSKCSPSIGHPYGHDKPKNRQSRAAQPNPSPPPPPPPPPPPYPIPSHLRASQHTIYHIPPLSPSQPLNTLSQSPPKQTNKQTPPRGQRPLGHPHAVNQTSCTMDGNRSGPRYLAE